MPLVKPIYQDSFYIVQSYFWWEKNNCSLDEHIRAIQSFDEMLYFDEVLCEACLQSCFEKQCQFFTSASKS